MSAGTVRELAQWSERVAVEPDSALHYAELVLAEGVTNTEVEPVVAARHVACLANVEKGNLGVARDHARDGLAMLDRSAFSLQALRLRLALAWIELDQGKTAASSDLLDSVESALRQYRALGEQLSTNDIYRAWCLRGLLQCQAGEFTNAVKRLDRTIPVLRAESDRRWVGNALVGRGIARMYVNELAGADVDFQRAEAMFRAAGLDARVPACWHNRGCVALRGGDIAKALRLFSDAETAGLDTSAYPESLVDHAEALSAAGLTSEARTMMERAEQGVHASGRHVRLPETQLALARCALADHDFTTTARAAGAAAELFRVQRRWRWAALASAIRWQARLSRGQPSGLSSAHRAAMDCADSGWPDVAVEVLITAGRAALRGGYRDRARELLSTAATRGGTQGNARQRAMTWLAAALAARTHNDRARLLECCRTGLRIVDEYAATFGSVELRARAGALASEFADVAVGAVLESGNARRVLAWTETYRAGMLARGAVRPPDDEELASELVGLRDAALRMRSGIDAPDGELRREVATRERRVRKRALALAGGAGLRSRMDFSQVASKLGESVLLTLFVQDGVMHGVSIVDGSVSLHRLCAQRDAERDLDALRMALGLRAKRAAVPAPRMHDDGLDHDIEVKSRRLQRALLGPILPRLADRPLVIVPTGPLHGLPWGVLPACRRRPLTIAPSIRAWLRASEQARESRAVMAPVWIAGPGLEHAEQEVRGLRREVGGVLLVGEDAHTSDVLSAMDGARLVHVAAHGRFRRDQPLLSCLEMSDGPLYCYDLDRLHHGPKVVVLSACEVGQSAVLQGDELMGIAATILGRGTATLIASVLPIPDERTAQLMASLHSGLRCGLTPATALANAQAEHGEVGFICLGYGE